MYSRQYFTITGNKFKDAPCSISQYSCEYVQSVMEPFLGLREPIAVAMPSAPTQSDMQIITLARNAKNSTKFYALMNGDISRYNNDESSADMALAGILAFYTSDAAQIERIMRLSRLRISTDTRKKWDRKDYLPDTIKKAVMKASNRFTALPPLSDEDKEMIAPLMAKIYGVNK